MGSSGFSLGLHCSLYKPSLKETGRKRRTKVSVFMFCGKYIQLICLTMVCWHPGTPEKLVSLTAHWGSNSSVCGAHQSTSRKGERRNIYRGQNKETTSIFLPLGRATLRFGDSSLTALQAYRIITCNLYPLKMKKRPFLKKIVLLREDWRPSFYTER